MILMMMREMMTMSGIKTGDPVILKDASGLESYGLSTGQKGWANSVQTLPTNNYGQMQTLVVFMPEDEKHMYYIDVGRVEFDEERSGLELNEHTIAKEV